jgi:DNA polymerase V
MLFADEDIKRKIAPMKSVDKVNERFGRGSLQNASHGLYRTWEMHRELLSPRYMTDWDEILTISI